MATTERTDESAPAASDVAESFRDAGLVRVVGAPRGDTLAAVGLLARALNDGSIPFQAILRRRGVETSASDADVTVAVGVEVPSATHVLGATPTTAAYAVADAFAAADPTLGLAGLLAADGVVTGPIAEDATAAGIERRPGLAIPTADVRDGLAHSTLVHGPFSGDHDAAAAALSGLEAGEPPTTDDERRRIASAVALAIGAEATPPSRAGTAVERFLRPYVGGPFETPDGYADVLDALARRDPGLGVATVLGHGDREAALDVWRAHGREVHRGVETAETRRHDGLLTATVDDVAEAAIEPVARLLRDFRSPEPAVLVRGGGRTALATTDGLDAASLFRDALEGTDAVVAGDAGIASAAIDDPELESTVRETVGRAQ